MQSPIHPPHAPMHNPCPYDLVIGLDRSDAKAELRVPHVCLSHEDPIARSGTIQ